jgi:hypothetical protein
MHITALMREYGAPMTRDEYLRWNSLGKKNPKVTPEEEADLPQKFAYPIVNHEELPEAKPGKGAPADFGGPVFPNPDNLVPLMDTEAPPVPKPSVKMDVSNPPRNQIEHHPLEKGQ